MPRPTAPNRSTSRSSAGGLTLRRRALRRPAQYLYRFGTHIYRAIQRWRAAVHRLLGAKSWPESPRARSYARTSRTIQTWCGSACSGAKRHCLYQLRPPGLRHAWAKMPSTWWVVARVFVVLSGRRKPGEVVDPAGFEYPTKAWRRKVDYRRPRSRRVERAIWTTSRGSIDTRSRGEGGWKYRLWYAGPIPLRAAHARS